MSKCICEFGSQCNGLGVVYCDGCGGDLCICACGGEVDCDGCIYCEGDLEPDFDLGLEYDEG